MDRKRNREDTTGFILVVVPVAFFADALAAAKLAGIQAAKNVLDFGVEAVISGNVGPKAFATLNAAGITVYTGASGTVQETLEAFKAGNLNKTDKATVEGHW